MSDQVRELIFWGIVTCSVGAGAALGGIAADAFCDWISKLRRR